MQSVSVKVVNKTGLHTRPAKDFVVLAKTFDSKVEIEKSGLSYNGKSLLKIMKAGICQNDEIMIKAEGVDEEKAVLELKAYVEGLDPES